MGELGETGVKSEWGKVGESWMQLGWIRVG